MDDNRVVVHTDRGWMAFQTSDVGSIILRDATLFIWLRGRADSMTVEFADRETAAERSKEFARMCGYDVQETPA